MVYDRGLGLADRDVEAGLEVLDVLPADKIGPPEILVPERIELVEGAQFAVGFVAVAAGEIVSGGEGAALRAEGNLAGEGHGDHVGVHVLSGHVAGLPGAFEIDLDPGERARAGDTGAEGVAVFVAGRGGEGVGLIVGDEPVEVDGLHRRFLEAAGGVHAVEVAAGILVVERGGVHLDKTGGDAVDFPAAGGGEDAPAVEGAAGVDPVERTEQALGAVVHLLATGAQGELHAADLGQDHIGESVLQVEGVTVDRPAAAREIARGGVGGAAFDEEAQVVAEGQIAMQPQPSQQEVVIVRRGEGEVVPVLEAYAGLPAEREGDAVGERHVLERVGAIVRRVFPPGGGVVEVTEVVDLDCGGGRCGFFGGGEVLPGGQGGEQGQQDAGLHGDSSGVAFPLTQIADICIRI